MFSSKDVARRAGVSQPTVSRVLNNPAAVKPETRRKVECAMEELGYYPNLIARSLVTNSTRTIALVSGTLKNGFFVQTTDSIVHYAKSRGYQTVSYFEDENETPDFWSSVMGLKVDGLLLSLVKLDDPLLERIERARLPCVFFNRRPRRGGNYVELDNRKAAELITRHLLELGHRNIGYISGETDISTFHDRRIGFERTLAACGLPPSAAHARYIRATDEEVARSVNELLRLPERPTVILCATDTIALAALNVILAAGLKVPDDISLAGFDNVQLSSHRAFGLTTVGHRQFAMGEISAAMLIDLIEHAGEEAAEPRQVVLEPELIVRQSTGRPRPG